MDHLPPMMRRPTADELLRASRREAHDKRRAAVENRANYRAAVLEILAELLEDEPIGGVSLAEAHGLTYDQAQRAQNALAKVIRHRAEKGGRILI